MMKAKMQLVSVAILGVFFSAILLAGISAHAEPNVKRPVPSMETRWDSGRPGGL